MRKEKTVELEGKEVKVYELRVRDYLEVFDQIGKDTSMTALRKLIEKNLPRATDLSMADFKNLAPSEIESLFAAFKEVNASFFKLAQQAGLGNVWEQMKAEAMKDLSELSANLFDQATKKP